MLDVKQIIYFSFPLNVVIVLRCLVVFALYVDRQFVYDSLWHARPVQLVSNEWSDVIVLVSFIDYLGLSVQHSLKRIYIGQPNASQEIAATIYLHDNKTVVDDSLGCL